MSAATSPGPSVQLLASKRWRVARPRGILTAKRAELDFNHDWLQLEVRVKFLSAQSQIGLLSVFFASFASSRRKCCPASTAKTQRAQRIRQEKSFPGEQEFSA